MSDQTGEKGETINSFIRFLYLLLVLCLFSLDQFIKLIVSHQFLPGEGIAVIKNIFHITLVQNTGIAFGILRNKNNLSFMLFILGLVLFAVLLLRKNSYSRIGKIASALIITGAISNLFDRIRLGFVIDYLDFRIWPVFNLADTAITIGICLTIWELFRKKCITS